MKIVINKDYGGFSISVEAAQWMAERGDEEAKYALRDYPSTYYGFEFKRTNPLLIEAVETLGSEVCSGTYACLKVVEIPDGIEWEIEEYDGVEWISEKHRTWS